MSRAQPYCIQEADLMIPTHWQDHSLNVFKIPPSDGAQGASLVISRDAQKGEQSLADYIDTQLKQCEQQLSGFKLRKREKFTHQERAAGWVEYTWMMEQRELLLRQVYYDLGTQALICTLTTTVRDLPHHDATWRKVMSSLTLVRATGRVADEPRPASGSRSPPH
jgi:hypothetical protein